MIDRNVQYPQRYQLQKVAGTDDIYDITPAPGEVEAEGTLINKATLLSDETAQKYGYTGDQLPGVVPDDVFADIYDRLLMVAQDKARLEVTVTDTDGTPIPGVLVSGLQDISGNDGIAANEFGLAIGYANEGSVNLTITGYADLENFSATHQVAKGLTYQIPAVVTPRNFLKITSSGAWKFSSRLARVDVTVVGGGGGGCGGYRRTSPDSPTSSNYHGRGGGGGYCTVQESVDFLPNVTYDAVIGAGGRAGAASEGYTSGVTNGGDGGISSFLGVSANGGLGGNNTSAGAGNGNGGTNSGAGGNGTVLGYSSISDTVLYGGGGGGGLSGQGGNDYGGDGAATGYVNAPAVAANTGGGGGGGQADNAHDRSSSGAAGGSGVIALRMYGPAA